MKHFHDRRYLVSFNATLLPQVFCDVLVIGSGIAGLRAAIAAAEHADVLIITKESAEESNTAHAQGGIAGALSPGDSAESHMADTLAAGQGLCESEVVKTITDEAPDRIRQLIEWGAKFDEEDGVIALTREGGHSTPRIAHAQGDATGREIETVLLHCVRENPRVRIMENAYVLDLITTDDEGCLGVLIQGRHRERMVAWAKQTIMAGGGCGRVFRETTNRPLATGDGVAMAYRAGVELTDLEFYQFHPTALYVAGASRALITEAVRGEGGHLLNSHHERFMLKYHELGELAPRDTVSRAIVKEIRETGHTCAYVDMRHIPADRLAKRFPGIRDFCAQYDINIATDLVPIRPAAHYMVGGIRVGIDGRSSVDRLFACGEVACTGLHGANRLGSNSLLEGLVIGTYAGRAAAKAAAVESQDPVHPRLHVRLTAPEQAPIDVGDVTTSLRAVTWRSVGIERSQFGLEEAVHMMQFWSRYVMDKEFDDVPGWQLQNMLLVARLMAQAALLREESRGVHYRTDFPKKDDENWKVHTIFRQGAGLKKIPPGTD